MGCAVRPTADRAREALFDILGPSVEDAAVLDLYCGTGILGLEALSRGARRVLAVDAEPRVVRAVRESAAALGATSREHEAIREDVSRWLRGAPIHEPFDLVFADPPWARRAGSELLRLLGARPWAHEGGLFVLERDGGATEPRIDPGPWIPVRIARYGRTVFELFRHAGAT